MTTHFPDYEPLNDVDVEELHDALATPNHKRTWYVIDAARAIVRRHENLLTQALLRERERGDSLEGMAERLADQHVSLQEAIAWAVEQSREWSAKMPRTQENGTYANGRGDGVDTTVRIVKAAVSAHLRGEPLEPRTWDALDRSP